MEILTKAPPDKHSGQNQFKYYGFQYPNDVIGPGAEHYREV